MFVGPRMGRLTLCKWGEKLEVTRIFLGKSEDLKKDWCVSVCWTSWTLDDKINWYPRLKLYGSWIIYIFNWDQQGTEVSKFIEQICFPIRTNPHTYSWTTAADWLGVGEPQQQERPAGHHWSESERGPKPGRQHPIFLHREYFLDCFSFIPCSWGIHAFINRAKLFDFWGFSPDYKRKWNSYFANIFIQQHANNW